MLLFTSFGCQLLIGVSWHSLSTWRSDNEVTGLIMWGSWRDQLDKPNMKYIYLFASVIVLPKLTLFTGTCRNLLIFRVLISTSIRRVLILIGSVHTLLTIIYILSSCVNTIGFACVYLLCLLYNLDFWNHILARSLAAPETIYLSSLLNVFSILMNGNDLLHSGALYLGSIQCRRSSMVAQYRSRLNQAILTVSSLLSCTYLV